MHFDVLVEGLDDLQREWKRSFLTTLRRGARAAVSRACAAGVATAKALVHVSAQPQGTHLRDEIYGRVTGEVAGGVPAIEGEIVAPKRYARYLEEGTAAHVIEARGKALAFDWKGVQSFFKRIHHPGTKPAPFMGPAYLSAERRLEAEMEKAVQEAVDRFNSAG